MGERERERAYDESIHTCVNVKSVWVEKAYGVARTTNVIVQWRNEKRE